MSDSATEMSNTCSHESSILYNIENIDFLTSLALQQTKSFRSQLSLSYTFGRSRHLHVYTCSTIHIHKTFTECSQPFNSKVENCLCCFKIHLDSKVLCRAYVTNIFDVPQSNLKGSQ